MTHNPPPVFGMRLVKWIEGYLDSGGRSAARGGSRILFLPWYSPIESQSSETLRGLAERLNMELVVLPTHYSITHDARLLADFVTRLCPADLAQKLHQALRELPYSASLEDAILAAIGAHSTGKKRIAVAALRSGADADSSVSRMLDWSQKLGLETVLVFAHRRPPGIVETLDIPLAELRSEILLRLCDQSLQSKQIQTEREWELRRAAAPRTEGRPDRPRPSFYRRLIGFLQRVTAPTATVVATESTDGPEDFETDADWADLLARFCGSNWAAADDVAKRWWPLEDIATEYRSKATSGEMRLNNPEEQEIFESRLRFLTILQVLYPQAFEAARHELDGTDQLYRIHLILCGATAKDSLLSESLIPFWREHLEDPLFCELFYACFHTIGRGRSLVERFESRSQLHGLLRVLEPDAVGISGAALKLLLVQRTHSSWIQSLARIGTESNRSAGRVALVEDERIISLMKDAEDLLQSLPTATEALQAAQAVLSVYELLVDEPGFAAEQYRSLIDRLTRKAISQSRAAIRFDASLMRTRALSLRREGMSALENLRIMRRTARDELARCAVQIEEAFVHEREADYLRAAQLYQDALGVAEDLGADELVARAASGCLRCDIGSDSKKTVSTVALRARIIVQIQAARTPELFPLSERNKPTLFISYRAETRAITKTLVPAINGPESSSAVEAWKFPLRTWADVIFEQEEDFSPTIHRRLHDSDAIILLLSPDYFNSPWCVHELHFALGQHEVRGVPLYWAWCSNETPEDQPCEFAAQEEIWQGGRGVELKRRGYELNHVQERLRRLFARGRVLVSKPLRFGECGRGDLRRDEPAGKELCAALGKEAGHLYTRAKLGKAPGPSI